MLFVCSLNEYQSEYFENKYLVAKSVKCDCSIALCRDKWEEIWTDSTTFTAG